MGVSVKRASTVLKGPELGFHNESRQLSLKSGDTSHAIFSSRWPRGIF